MVVLNLSQQTDSSDLIGGFRPVQPGDAVLGLLSSFAALVQRTWRRGNNDEFLGRVLKLGAKRKWGQVIKAFRTALQKLGVAAEDAASNGGLVEQPASAKKRKGPSTTGLLDQGLRDEWQQFACQVEDAAATAAAAEEGFAFAFAEGALVRAVREGWWLLLDEVNLAPPEVRAAKSMMALPPHCATGRHYHYASHQRVLTFAAGCPTPWACRRWSASPGSWRASLGASLWWSAAT